MSLSQATLMSILPDTVLLPSKARKYVPDGVVVELPWGPPWIVTVRDEDPAAVTVGGVKTALPPISGRLQAFKATLDGNVPDADNVTVSAGLVVLVWNCETGRTRVVVATLTAML